TDPDGTLAATLADDALPDGYGPLSATMAGLIHISGGRSSYYYALGETSGLWAIWGSNQDSSAGAELDAQLTMEPNNLAGSIDPVSLLGDLDRRHMVEDDSYATPASIREL